MDHYLFVCDNLEDWEADKECWDEFGSVYIYAVNYLIPEFSEFGEIGVKHTTASGLRRIW